MRTLEKGWVVRYENHHAEETQYMQPRNANFYGSPKQAERAAARRLRWVKSGWKVVPARLVVDDE